MLDNTFFETGPLDSFTWVCGVNIQLTPELSYASFGELGNVFYLSEFDKEADKDMIRRGNVVNNSPLSNAT